MLVFYYPSHKCDGNDNKGSSHKYDSNDSKMDFHYRLVSANGLRLYLQMALAKIGTIYSGTKTEILKALPY
jgi:hypothetical protein